MGSIAGGPALTALQRPSCVGGLTRSFAGFSHKLLVVQQLFEVMQLPVLTAEQLHITREASATCWVQARKQLTLAAPHWPSACKPGYLHAGQPAAACLAQEVRAALVGSSGGGAPILGVRHALKSSTGA